MSITPVSELGMWIDAERTHWNELGADILRHRGQTVFGMWPTGLTSVKGFGLWIVYVGTVEMCVRLPSEMVASEFVRLTVLGDLSVEHSKILIENAVEQVAGR